PWRSWKALTSSALIRQAPPPHTFWPSTSRGRILSPERQFQPLPQLQWEPLQLSSSLRVRAPWRTSRISPIHKHRLCSAEPIATQVYSELQVLRFRSTYVSRYLEP